MSEGEANIWNPRTLLELSADTLRIEESQTATEGQTLFNITTFAYSLGVGSLAVYKNGLFQKLGIDWNEQTDTSFTLIVPATAGDYVSAVGFVGMTGEGGGGGTTPNPIFDSVRWDHATDPAKLQYQAEYRDFLGNAVFFLEPINIVPAGGVLNDRSITLVTHDGDLDEYHNFGFNKAGFFVAPAIQLFTTSLPTEAVRFDLIDDGGTITATFAPVSADKLQGYRFTTDSTTGSEIYAGFKTGGQGYGKDPLVDDDFVTLQYFNANTPGGDGFVTLVNDITAENLTITYSQLLGSNTVVTIPVDANKTTGYIWFTNTTVGSELAAGIRLAGTVFGEEPTQGDEFVTLNYYNTNPPTINWGDIGGTLSNQTDLDTVLDSLQSQITALQADSPAGWQKPVAMIEYNPSVGGNPIGTTRGCSGAVVNTDDIRVTLDSPTTNMNNMKIGLGHQDAIFAPAEVAYTKINSSVVDISVKNTITGASAAAVVTVFIYDAGLS